MTIPLWLVRAKLLLHDLQPERRNFGCIAISCGAVIVDGRLLNAEDENLEYLSKDNSAEDAAESQDITGLRSLASLLLCPEHEEKFCGKIARGWDERRPNDDLLRLFELNRNPFDWKCLDEHCNTAYNMRRSLILDTLEALTFDLSSVKKGKKVRKLVGLLHCDEHTNPDGVLRISNKWNEKLTSMIQREESRNSHCKEITPKKTTSKDTHNQDTIPTQHESEAKPIRPISDKSLFDSQPAFGGSGGESGGLFGSIPALAGSGKEGGGLFGHKPALAGSGEEGGGLFGHKPAFGRSSGEGGGLFGHKPALAGAGGEGGGFGRKSPSGDFGKGRGGLYGQESGSDALERSSRGSLGQQSGSDGVESPSTAFTTTKFDSESSESSGKASAWKLALERKPRPETAPKSASLNSGLLSPNPSPPSSRKTPVSTTEQTKTVSPRSKGPVIFTDGVQGRRSSSPRRTASFLSKPSPVDDVQGSGSAGTNSISPWASAARNPRSHSSSEIVGSSQEPHDYGTSPLRRTLSYLNLPSEGPTRSSDPVRAVPTQTSPMLTTLEDEVFTDQTGSKFEPRVIDMKLLQYIRSTRVYYGKTSEYSFGDVYVLRNPAWPNHVKIGESGCEVDKRIAQIKGKCNIECLEQSLDTEQRDFLNYKLVEKLCHKELQNFRKKLRCKSCKNKMDSPQMHEEWFQVRPEVAVRTVQKWRKWMLTSPYNDDGHLVPWWRDKANHELMEGRPFDDKGQRIDDDASRHERWSRWLERPTISERADFEIKRFCFDPRPRRKSLWSTAEENIILLLTYVIILGFICEPKVWILVVLIFLMVLRDWE